MRKENTTNKRGLERKIERKKSSERERERTRARERKISWKKRPCTPSGHRAIGAWFGQQWPNDVHQRRAAADPLLNNEIT
jgi:hypothetical protein